MGHTEDLLEGLATAIAAAGIAAWHDGVYASSDIGVGIGKLPQSCDQAIGITDYVATDDNPTQALGKIGVQFWVGSSRVDLQACKLEYSIVSPK